MAGAFVVEITRLRQMRQIVEPALLTFRGFRIVTACLSEKCKTSRKSSHFSPPTSRAMHLSTEVGAACEVAFEVHFDIVLVQAQEVVFVGFCSTATCSETAVEERSDPKFSSDVLNRWTVV